MARFLAALIPALLLVGCGGEEDPYLAKSCVECHEELNPGLIADLRASPHQKVPVTCEACHGENHDVIFATKGAVPPTVCAECHETAYEEFSRSRHGRYLREGKPNPLLDEQSFVVGGCNLGTGCHTIQQRYPDGSVGRCGSCHPTHAMSNHEARNPRICLGCHGGTDHPQYEAWQRSAHSLESPSHEGPVADCVTCHDTHDVSAGITHGLTPLAAENPPLSVPTLPIEEFTAKREVMLGRCRDCHGTRFAKAALDKADTWRRRGAVILDQARRIVTALAKDGYLAPGADLRLPNPATGHGFALGPAQVFDLAASVPERIYYEMYFHLYPKLWRAAYHTDPERIAWEVNDALKTSLDRLRDLDRRARR